MPFGTCYNVVKLWRYVFGTYVVFLLYPFNHLHFLDRQPATAVRASFQYSIYVSSILIKAVVHFSLSFTFASPFTSFMLTSTSNTVQLNASIDKIYLSISISFQLRLSSIQRTKFIVVGHIDLHVLLGYSISEMFIISSPQFSHTYILPHASVFQLPLIPCLMFLEVIIPFRHHSLFALGFFQFPLVIQVITMDHSTST